VLRSAGASAGTFPLLVEDGLLSPRCRRNRRTSSSSLWLFTRSAADRRRCGSDTAAFTGDTLSLFVYV